MYTTPCEVTTATGSTVTGRRRESQQVVAISIIRAGDSMLDSFMNVVPDALVGKILIQRNEATAGNQIGCLLGPHLLISMMRTVEPIFYYSKCPGLVDKRVYLLDPMLATGGSAVAAIRHLLLNGALEENIVFLNVVSCPEGLTKMFAEFPKLTIVTGAVDQGLNEKVTMIAVLLWSLG